MTFHIVILPPLLSLALCLVLNEHYTCLTLSYVHVSLLTLAFSSKSCCFILVRIEKPQKHCLDQDDTGVSSSQLVLS